MRLAGMCTFCGKRPPKIGKSRCSICNAGRAAYYHQRIKDNKCPCGVTLVTGKRCSACLRKSQESHYAMVADVIGYYGGKCACCGQSELIYLTIDHINGGGNAHAREIGRGVALYRWLRRYGFPEGFQVLCANCNHGRARNGGICPHYGIIEPAYRDYYKISRRCSFQRTVAAYGGKCSSCGEDNLLFLCLDHVNNDGAEHRRTINHQSLDIWARQNNYPDILQLLCDNCNLAKERPFLSAVRTADTTPTIYS
jgi:hypothetical protein